MFNTFYKHKLLLSISIVFFPFVYMKAQVEKTYYIIKSGQIPIEVIPKADQTRYSEFRDGVVQYLNGRTEAGKFNYNFLYKEMHYINAAGDTMVLRNNDPVKTISIGEDQYFLLFGQGYIELLTATFPIALARTESMSVILGGYPTSRYSSENTYIGEPPTLRQVYHHRSDNLMRVLKRADYIFMDRNLRFHPAKKAILFKLFPEKRREIHEFIKNHQINFNNPAHLQKVIEFTAQAVEATHP